MALDKEHSQEQLASYLAESQARIAGSADEIFESAMVHAKADGYVVKVGDSGGLGIGPVLGVAKFGQDNSSGSDGDKNIDLLTGLFARKNSAGSAVTIADFGKIIYAEDDETVSDDDTDPVAGTMWGFTEESTPRVIVLIGASSSVSDLAADLASILNGFGASMVGVEDVAGTFAGADVEAVLAEIITLLASIVATEGSAMIGTEDVGAYFAGATVEAILQEIGANTGAGVVGILDAAAHFAAVDVEGALAENATAINVLRPGAPMMNRVIMLGAPGAIVALDTVTIGTDIYEFNAATPPAAGTAGSIWVYQGANSADSRANLINAINGVIDAPNITYDGAVVETMLAVAGTTLGTVNINSADAIGGAITPSAVGVACAEGLTTVTDIWDANATYAGEAAGETQSQMVTFAVTAAEITAGFVEIYFDFTPTSVMLNDRNVPMHDEPYTITGDAVVLTLTGGGAPNIQAGDVIDIHVQG